MNYKQKLLGIEYGIFHSMSVANTGCVCFNCKMIFSAIPLCLLCMLLIMYVVFVV